MRAKRGTKRTETKQENMTGFWMDQGMTYWLAVEMARELQMRSELLFVSPDWQILKYLSEQSQWIQNWAVASLHKLHPARMVTHTEIAIRDGKIQLGYYLDPKKKKMDGDYDITETMNLFRARRGTPLDKTMCEEMQLY